MHIIQCNYKHCYYFCGLSWSFFVGCLYDTIFSFSYVTWTFILLMMLLLKCFRLLMLFQRVQTLFCKNLISKCLDEIVPFEQWIMVVFLEKINHVDKNTGHSLSHLFSVVISTVYRAADKPNTNLFCQYDWNSFLTSVDLNCLHLTNYQKHWTR